MQIYLVDRFYLTLILILCAICVFCLFNRSKLVCKFIMQMYKYIYVLNNTTHQNVNFSWISKLNVHSNWINRNKYANNIIDNNNNNKNEQQQKKTQKSQTIQLKSYSRVSTTFEIHTHTHSKNTMGFWERFSKGNLNFLENSETLKSSFHPFDNMA